MRDLNEFLMEAAELVDAALEELVPKGDACPESLSAGMLWSLFGSGKRFRPALVFAAGRAFGADDRRLVGTAAAIEMLHTYSLIHDDLPAMDDDDLRRGRLTCHKKFGEATAILAGDALQALTFQTIAEDTGLDLATRVELLSGLGRAASRMVSGQQMDLEAEGGEADLAKLESIHRNKTGALIAFSAAAGARIADASVEDVSAMHAYGEKIGLLFQVVDDILDVTQPTENLGKTAGKDIAANKLTYPAILGLERSEQLAEGLCSEALMLLPEAVAEDEVLTAIPNYLLLRKR